MSADATLGRDGTWRTLARHQLGAALAALVDFGAMVFAVRGAGWTPVEGTALGASLGGVANFTLGRAWIFRRREGALPSQAVRYAAVSAASAGWNTLGEHLVHDAALVPYVSARLLVSVAVSLLWNFPVQRWFVFREGAMR